MGSLSRQSIRFAAIAAVLAALVVPASSRAHETGTMDTAQEHMEEDSVSLTQGEERRLERHTDEVTAGDATRAEALVADDPGQVGLWGPVDPWPVVGIHMALLTDGKVLAYDSNIPEGSESANENQTFSRATVWNPATGQHSRADAMTGVNIFCSGLAHLMDGTVFLAGGNRNGGAQPNVGITATHEFDAVTKTWTRTEDMEYERWYPSVTPLANGEMLITEGVINTATNGDDRTFVPEVRETDGQFRQLDNASRQLDLYPWMDVAPNGNVFMSGPYFQMQSLNPSGLGSWQGSSVGTRDDEYRSYGSHALYDIGKILVSGGGGDSSPQDESSKTSVVINLNAGAPQVSATDSMGFGRRQHNLTVLADGSVLATGGNSSGESLIDLQHGVYNAERWDPATGHWTTLAAEEKTRQYHSTALLLPDGRVLSAGGGICGACEQAGYLEKNGQVFSPPYLFKQDGSGDLAARPVIGSAPGTIGYDASMSIRSPDAEAIGKVALMRLGAVTHSVNMEQRYVPLNYSTAGERIVATSPLNANIAPPGYYMLFVIGTDGVPSNSKMVRIDPNALPRPAAPSIAATLPVSPANDNDPQIKGTAISGSTVKIYSGADCNGTPMSRDTAAHFATPGITVAVPGDTTTNLTATATDGVDNESDCSSAVAYREDSTAPETTTDVSVDGDEATATFSSEEAASFECSLDERGFTSCGSPQAYPGLSPGTHGFEVRAADPSGNTDPSPARENFTVATPEPPPDAPGDTTPPRTRIIKMPKPRSTKEVAAFSFGSSEAMSAFRCRVDGRRVFCGYRLSMAMELGKHRITVAAIDAAGNADLTPARYSWRVNRSTTSSRIGVELLAVAAVASGAQ